MQPFEPDFEIIKMDAEIGSYQEDYEPVPGEAPEPPHAEREPSQAAEG